MILPPSLAAALACDSAVETALQALGIVVAHSKDAVIFEREEILTACKTPYGVFTPYKNAWQKTLTPC
jgi:deoxyribodipyrimidine photo-lyase